MIFEALAGRVHNSHAHIQESCERLLCPQKQSGCIEQARPFPQVKWKTCQFIGTKDITRDSDHWGARESGNFMRGFFDHKFVVFYVQESPNVLLLKCHSSASVSKQGSV